MKPDEFNPATYHHKELDMGHLWKITSKSHRCFSILSATFVGLLLGLTLSIPASGAIWVDVTGIRSTGITEWTFHGSDTITDFGGTVTASFSWNNFSSYVNETHFPSIPPGQLAITNTTKSTSQTGKFLSLADGGANFDDDFILNFNGPLDIENGDVFTLAGTFNMNIDINQLAPNGLPYSGTNTQTSDFGSLALSVVAIPEPTTLILSIALLSGMFYPRRRPLTFCA
jgi:hypothetical protein